MDLLTNIKKVTPLPYEQVLRHVVHKIRNNYSDKWLMDICTKQGNRDILMDCLRRGVLDGLKGYPRNSYYPPRLTIELVPRSSWFNNVRSEVTSKQWDTLRKKTAKAANFCCEICGGQGHRWPVECHEIWHYDEVSQVQLLAGLISLCPSCHEVKHIGLTELKRKRDEATAHLGIVNGWSLAGAEDYIEHSFDIWRHRSELPWQVDISWLEGEGIRLYSETDRSHEQFALDLKHALPDIPAPPTNPSQAPSASVTQAPTVTISSTPAVHILSLPLYESESRKTTEKTSWYGSLYNLLRRSFKALRNQW